MTRTAFQIVHGYNEPFHTLSNLYARTLRDLGWKVRTYFLEGAETPAIRASTIADEIVFLNLQDQELKGLKLGLIARLRAQIKEADARLIVAQRYKSIYLSLMASRSWPIPVLGVGHAFGVLDSLSRRIFLNRFRQRFTMVGVSQSVSDDLLRHRPRHQVVTIANAIDAESLRHQLYERDLARSRLGLEPGQFAIGNVGRLHSDKDQATLIRAFSRIVPDLPQARLLLIGVGKKEAEYRQLVNDLKLGERVRLLGFVPEAARHFRAFDVYVSSSDREPFGMVLLEAMLAGVPVISTDCGGAPEPLGPTATYFKKGDDATLAEHLKNIAHLPHETRLEQGDQLQLRVLQQFSYKPFAERLGKVIQRLTGSLDPISQT